MRFPSGDLRHTWLFGVVLVAACGGTSPTPVTVECDGGRTAGCSGGVGGARADAAEPGTSPDVSLDIPGDSGRADGGGGGGDAGGFGGDSGGGDTSDGGDAGECVTGALDMRACGMCGRQGRSCQGGLWQPWGECSGQGTCMPGATETGTCGVTAGPCQAGTHSRMCSTACNWNAWGACGGDYVGPTPEICGDNVDNNCNGVTDEGCACMPVAAGHAGTMTIAGGISKLVGDPGGCIVYGLVPGSPSSVSVIDTARKTELARMTLAGAADDLSVSRNGRWLVAALDSRHELAVVDKTSWTARSVAVAADPERVQISNAGLAYYVTLDQWTQLHRVDLNQAAPTDTWLANSGYQPDIQLNADGTLLFIGESGSTGSGLEVLDLGGGSTVIRNRSTWNGNSGLSNIVRSLYLGPRGGNIYFSGHQFDATNLGFMRGASGQVFVEDAAGTFAIATAGPIDARLLQVIAPFPTPASAAALAASDTEIWWYDAAASMLHYENVADRIGAKTLGVREQPAELVKPYHFTHLVADPVRPLLYGLDPDAAAVVSIDRSTLQPISAVIMGSSPSDIDVDPTGAFLYVAHEETQGVGQIRLDSFAFAQFLPAYRDGFDIATLGPDLVVTIDRDQYNSTSLFNVRTGTRTDYGAGGFEAALAATADGRTLFIGESQISGVSRHDVSNGQLVGTAMSKRDFAGPPRWLVVTPNGDGVYYGGYFMDGATLNVARYRMIDTILTVTADSRLAISATKVYRVTDGALLGTLSTSGSVQAASPDGSTLYLATPNGIASVDLEAFSTGSSTGGGDGGLPPDAGSQDTGGGGQGGGDGAQTPGDGGAPVSQAPAQLAVGDYFTCAVKADQTIACWGWNQFGRAEPPAGRFVQVGAGAYFACGLATDGSITCWGSNSGGALLVPDGTFRQISVGSSQACALRNDATLACWGEMAAGPAAAPPGRFIQVSTGSDLTCALREDHTIACWQYLSSPVTAPTGTFSSVSVHRSDACAVNDQGQATCWTTHPQFPAPPGPPSDSFIQVGAGDGVGCGLRNDHTIACWGKDTALPWGGGVMPPEGTFSSISIGATHSCAIGSDGSVACWGNSSIGGRAPVTGPQLQVAVAGGNSEVFEDGTHGCALHADHTVACWGQEGSNYALATTPGGTFASLATGVVSSCGIHVDGSLSCWGDNQSGETNVPAGSFRQVSVGSAGACAIANSGGLSCWGSGAPPQPTLPPPLQQVAVGRYHACAVASSGAVLCWGSNSQGQASPPQGTFVQISVSASHSCGVRSDGRLACWGSQIIGESSPPAGTFVKVAAGGGAGGIGRPFACAIATDHTVTCWGDDTVDQYNVPHQPFIDITAADTYACALDESQRAWCWGYYTRQPL